MSNEGLISVVFDVTSTEECKYIELYVCTCIAASVVLHVLCTYVQLYIYIRIGSQMLIYCK